MTVFNLLCLILQSIVITAAIERSSAVFPFVGLKIITMVYEKIFVFRWIRVKNNSKKAISLPYISMYMMHIIMLLECLILERLNMCSRLFRSRGHSGCAVFNRIYITLLFLMPFVICLDIFSLRKQTVLRNLAFLYWLFLTNIMPLCVWPERLF